MAIERYPAFGGIVEARDELGDRGLASAVFPHERDALTGLERHVDVADGPSLAAGVPKSDVLERESALNRLRDRARIRW
jgi:hypothetical protein